MESAERIFQKGNVVDGKYSIVLFIKHGQNAETYRVKGADNKLYFLKIFKISKLSRSAFDTEGNILEIELLKSANHTNIIKYVDAGETVVAGKKYIYLVVSFVAGETLAEKITRESFTSQYDITNIGIQILEGLKHLHSCKEPIIHNEITPQNVMLDMSVTPPQVRIIDFGYARPFHSTTKLFNKDGLDFNYVASEALNGLFSPQSDVFSVASVLYQLLYGLPPWFRDISKYQNDRTKAEDVVLENRKKPLLFQDPSETIIDFDPSIIPVLKKALNNDPEMRFETVSDFVLALKGEIVVQEKEQQKAETSSKASSKPRIERAKGKGFDAIAGMQELKDQMKLDVIDALNNPEEYAKYGVTIPNGMLLYGPPGCGKTFFAKHFAEEVGFNFMLMTPAKLKSRFVNASQENIAKMFEEAEKNAPTIIFIDEINELLPNRDSDAHEMSKSAVNEMLAQMDRTGEKGIFIVGATNYPHQIDPAMLRAGRLDKKFYLSPPDFEARKAMFDLYLKGRPLDLGLNYEELATRTENYVSADIEHLVNEASRLALKRKARISMEILETVITSTPPSVPLSELQKYEEVNKSIIQENKQANISRPKIGFKS